MTGPAAPTATLLLRLKGPLQSYGTRSLFERRDTGGHPTKSALVGLLAAALGRDRDEDIADLASLDCAVRLDEPGRRLRDYQTVGIDGWRSAAGKVTTGQPKISERWYLADAVFTAALTGQRPLIEQAAAALRRPVWPVYLGRRCCVPTAPILIGVSDAPTPAGGLATLPYQGDRPRPPATAVVITTGYGGESVDDQPVAFGSRRRHAARSTARTRMSLPAPAPDARPEADPDNPYELEAP